VNQTILQAHRHESFREDYPEKYQAIENLRQELNLIVHNIRTGVTMQTTHFRQLVVEYFLIEMIESIVQVDPERYGEKYAQMMADTLEHVLSNRMDYQQRRQFALETWAQIEQLISGEISIDDFLKAIETVHQEKHITNMWINQQLAPNDVYTYLTDIFQIPDSINWHRDFQCQDANTGQWFHREPIAETANFMVTVNAIGLTQNLSLTDLLTKEEVVTDEHSPIQCNQGESHHYIQTSRIVNHPNLVAIYTQKPGIQRQRQATIPDPLLFGNLALTAMIVHRGTVRSGHYYAYIRCQGQWYLYDDLKISLILQENLDPIIYKNAIMFLYLAV